VSTTSTPSLLSLVAPGGWQEDAACRDAPPELFFSSDEHDRQQAVELCSTCPVRTQCLEQALVAGESYGIWGGTDEQERKRLLRHRRAA
jgi:WhiB family transcriptional regulator, redox-sensing transcriptional regulator